MFARQSIHTHIQPTREKRKANQIKTMTIKTLSGSCGGDGGDDDEKTTTTVVEKLK